VTVKIQPRSPIKTSRGLIPLLGFLAFSPAFAGSFSTLSGLDGGTFKSGFASMESAAQWGWKNSIFFPLQLSSGLRYAGAVYYKINYLENAPPNQGYTNYWWSFFGPSYPGGPSSNLAIIYPISWNPADALESKDFGGSACGTTQASPSEGNTVQFSRGNNFQTDNDTSSQTEGPLFQRVYNSNYTVESGPLGEKWHHNYEQSVIQSPSQSINLVTVQQADGKANIYTLSNGAWSSDADVKDTLVSLTDSSGNFSGWQVVVADKNSTETYDVTGHLQTVKDSQGLLTTLSYNANKQLATVTDSFGRALTLSYDSQGHITDLATPSGGTYHYDYDTLNRLSKVTYPDSRVRQYFYEQSSLPYALTGIADERGVRNATWVYDDQGRVTSSEQAGGVGNVQVDYTSDSATTVTGALGKKTTYHYQTVLGVKHITAIEGIPSANCPNSNSTFTYDNNGNVLTKTDALGQVTTYTYNDRNLEASRTEASGTPLARTTTTEWDPSRFLKTKVVEPTRTTVYTYDAQGRPLSQQTTPN
jgi:YD repeat-containing protein